MLLTEQFQWGQRNAHCVCPARSAGPFKGVFSVQLKGMVQQPDCTELTSKWKVRKRWLHAQTNFLKRFFPLDFSDTILSWFFNLSFCLFFLPHLCWVTLYLPLNVEVLQNLGHLMLFPPFHLTASVTTCRPVTPRFYTGSLSQISPLSSRIVYSIACSRSRN